MTERDVFIAALQREDPAGRQAYLDEACAGRPELRRQVEQLLRLYEGAGSFLEQPAAESAATGALQGAAEQASSGEAPGALIGPYKLIEQIGEGGMGTVWMAQQTEPVNRLVAVKLIKAGMDSKQVLARFEAERQALALMDHPNIAKVLDAGATAAGRPYFVMDLVKGAPITRYCDEQKLTPRQPLELFVPVCQAVQHAHQKGVIHRDLKPSNVLVAAYDGRPVPKIIDFGVAKAAGQPLTDKTLVTGYGAIVGTLEYMSPEQAEINQLDIDTRSDIYSLGVLLYELLAGSTPFTKQDLQKSGMLEMLRVIREQEPTKPSAKLSTAEGLPTLAANRGTEPAKLTKLVRGELDWIVMKALEKDRSRRYETANGFAMDVQRYLADEPVQACPPSACYRLRKFARRNKGGLAMAALVLFFLMLLGSAVGWAVRDRAARETEAGQQRAARQAKAAGQVESVFAEVDRLEGEREWHEALAAARRAEAAVAGGEADAETTERVRARLNGLEFIDRLEQIRMEDRESQADYVKRDRDYAQAFRDYGVDLEELTVEASIERLKAYPAPAIAIAAALDEWISLVVCLPGRERLAAVAHGIDPEPVRDRLRSTWGRPVEERRDELRRLAGSIDVRAQHPATLDSLAHGLKQADLPDYAIRILREAQSVYPRDYRFSAELGDALYRQRDLEGAIRFYTVAACLRPDSYWRHYYRAVALRRQGKLDEALVAYRKAAEISPRAGSMSLGWVLYSQGKLDEAVVAFRKVVELDPDNVDGHRSLGLALRDQNKLEEANAAFDRAIDFDRKAVELNPRSAGPYVSLGFALHERGKREEAVEVLRKAVAINPNDSAANLALGDALRTQGKPDEAVVAYRKYIELAPNDLVAHNVLGTLLRDELQDDGKAIECFRRAIQLDPKFAPNYSDLGLALFGQGKPDEAAAAYRRALEIDPSDYRANNGLAWWLAAGPNAELRDPDQAVSLAKRAVEFAPKMGTYQNTLGVALYRAGDWKGAIASLNKSMALSQGGDGFDWFFLAMAHWRLGEKDKAREWYDRAANWMGKHDPKNEELRRFRAEAEELMKEESERKPN